MEKKQNKLVMSFFSLYKHFLILFIIITCFSCSNNRKKDTVNLSNTFIANILDLKGIPDSPQDRSVSSFCDLGAWHAFTLPNDNPEFYGGFIGPFSMDRNNGIWLGQKFGHLTLYDKKQQKLKYVNVISNQYPGYLEQHLVLEKEGLEVNLKLWYSSKESIIVSAKIINQSPSPIEIYFGWSGETWLDTAFYQIKDQLSLAYSDSNTIHNFQFDRDFKTRLGDSNKSYNSISTETLKVESHSEQNISLRYSFHFDASNSKNPKNSTQNSVRDSYKKTINRWKSYHDSFPYREGHWLDSTNFEILKSKSIQTLVNNWKSAAGELKYDGLFPSYLYKGFHGFWAWDSWKHAVALARFEPKLAKNQILTMFSFQNKEGMIPDCIFRDTLIEKHNWRDTKPPLAAWAVNEIFEKTNDTVFASTMFPKLIKYHNWWYKNRDHNRNKLCEYGSSDGTRIAAAWESGMDNAVRFDNALLVNNNPKAWSLNQESVDLNAYLLDEKKQLIKLAKITKNISSITTLEKDYNEISTLFNNTFYNTNIGYYFDRQTDNNQEIQVIGPEGWLPLWAGIATSKTAESVKNKILDEAIFYSKVPFPTLNISHKDFDPKNGYWRGPVWLDQAYFAIVGLEKYGYHEEAKILKLKIVKNAEGLLEKGQPIRENYHPISGKGLNANHFSWSAAHLLLLIE